MNEESFRFVISLLAPDRVGILQEITAAVADMGGNIDGMSQTVIHGYFTVILTASFQKNYSQDEIREAIHNRFEPGTASVVTQPWKEPTAQVSRKSSGRYIFTLTEKTGRGF